MQFAFLYFVVSQFADLCTGLICSVTVQRASSVDEYVLRFSSSGRDFHVRI